MLYKKARIWKAIHKDTQMHISQTNVLQLTMQTPAQNVEYKIPTFNHSASGSFSVVDLRNFCSMCHMIPNMGDVIIYFWLLV